MINVSIEKHGKYAVLESDRFEEIREHFSEADQNAKFAQRINKHIPSRQYAITPTGRFDAPLFSEILKYILSQGIKEQVNATPEFKRAICPAKELWKTNTPNYSDKPYELTLPLRDYQQDIVMKCLNVGRGTIVLATAGGKTLTMGSLISRIYTFYPPGEFKCLLIVPDRGLVEQTYNDLVSYKVPFTISKWTGDDALDLSADVIIANVGILQSENSNINWIEFVDLLVVDEVHKIRRGNKISDLIKTIKTPCKFGFTGTLPEGLLDQWNIIGKIGPILYEKDSKALRAEKYVADVLCQIINIKYKKLPTATLTDKVTYREEVDFLVNSPFRNEVVGKLAKTVNKNCLILIDYIAHGQAVEQAVKSACPNKLVFFVQGSVEIEERERIKELMEKGNDVVVVAVSKIFSTGINIKNLHYIIFAGGGKAKIKIVQSIGRGLRLHENKNRLVLLDIADDLNYGIKHAEKRQSLYTKEGIPFVIEEITEK